MYPRFLEVQAELAFRLEVGHDGLPSGVAPDSALAVAG